MAAHPAPLLRGEQTFHSASLPAVTHPGCFLVFSPHVPPKNASCSFSLGRFPVAPGFSAGTKGATSPGDPFGQAHGGSWLAGGWHEPPVPQQKSWRVKHGSYIFIRGSHSLQLSPGRTAPASISVIPGQMEMDRDSPGWRLRLAQCVLSTLRSKPQFCLFVSLMFRFWSSSLQTFGFLAV